VKQLSWGMDPVPLISRLSAALFSLPVAALIGCASQPDPEPIPPPPDRPSEVESPRPERPELRVGQYFYLADAAIVIDCFTGESYPVAMTADNIALERAYLETRSFAAETLVVVYRGVVEERPAMEPDLTQEQMVVERFLTFLPGESCDGPGEDQVIGTSWRLVGINSMGVVLPPDNRPPSLTFEPDSRIAGFTGCNNLFGAYRIAGSLLRISGIGTTKKYCPQVSSLEEEYTMLLNRTVSFELHSDELVLISAESDSLLFVRQDQ